MSLVADFANHREKGVLPAVAVSSSTVITSILLLTLMVLGTK